MAPGECAIFIIYRRFKPHLLMVLVQICNTVLYFMSESSFNRGMNPHVFVTYRHIVGGLVTCPFAYFIERKTRPKLTLRLLGEISMLSLIGIALTLNMYFASLKYTSPSFLVAMINTIPSITFAIAFTFGMEKLDVRNPRGMAKIGGTIACLAGVMMMTLYKGPVARSLWGTLIYISRSTVHENWVKGSILTVASCLSGSLWYILQAITLKKFPAPLSLTVMMNIIGGAQTAVFASFMEHKPSAWLFTSKIEYLTIIYAGVVASALTIVIQLWCTEKKGPVFVTMFSPLVTILVTASAYFIFGEKLYLGNILGGFMAIIGLYLLLWGKEGDQKLSVKSEEQLPSADDEQKKPNMQSC